MAALIRAPVRVTLCHESHVTDEGENYSLSYPQLEIPGLPVRVTFFDESNGDAILGNLAADDSRILPAVVSLLAGFSPGLAQMSAKEIERVAPTELVTKLDRLARAAWYLTLRGADNCDVDHNPEIVIQPLFLGAAPCPAMSAP